MAEESMVALLPEPGPLAVRNGVLVCSGYGLKIRVERAHLAVTDNHLGNRREIRLARATAKLKRLVVLGHTGSVTLDALRWLADVGAAFVQIDADARVVTCSAPLGLDDPRLRRAQAVAGVNGVGLDIARGLIQQKIEGQRQLLPRLPGGEGASAAITAVVNSLEAASTIEEVRAVEAVAAAAYWNAWASMPVRFVRKDVERVPEHWRTFGARTSPLTGSPRTAANPANALLNYLYAMLETETRIAALTMGLDPGLGILHADQRARDSLVFDLLEPVRPSVDAFLLELVANRLFAAREFHETQIGSCRLIPPLPQALAESSRQWATLVGPIVEDVARALFNDKTRQADRRHATPTPLSERTRSAGRGTARSQPRGAAASSLRRTCLECGAVLDNRERSYCDECLPARMRDAADAFSDAGPQTLAALRVAGTDPAHGGDAARKRGETNARHARDAHAWEHEHAGPPDLEAFLRDILPALKGVPVSKMVEVTGLSLRWCSLIRRGLRVPHPRHWEALGRLAAEQKIGSVSTRPQLS